MTSPKNLLPIFGLAGLAASAMMPDQPAQQPQPKAAEPPPPPTPASAPSTSKPQRKAPGFLSGASLLPLPGTATQGKTLLGA